MRSLKIYHAEILVRIGKTVSSGFTSPSPSFAAFDTLENLVKIIPAKYGLGEESLEYNLSVEMINGTSLIKIALEGPDERKTKELFNEVVENTIADHYRMTERSILPYQALIGKLERDISDIQNELAQEVLELEEMSIGMDMEMGAEMDVDKTEPFTLMMIQNNKLRMKEAVQINLKQSRINIRHIQDDIFMHQLTINSLKENKTKSVGEVSMLSVRPNMKRNVIAAGVVGLMMSLFLAFFIEFLGNVMEGEKEKKKKDSV